MHFSHIAGFGGGILCALGCVLVALLSRITPRRVQRAAFAAVLFTVLAAVLGYKAVSGEITGKTICWPDWREGGPVMRESAPAEFRRYANYTWVMTAYCTVWACVSVGFYWKIRDDGEDADELLDF